MRRAVCWLLGHRWSDWYTAGRGEHRGREVRVCHRCAHPEYR